MPIDYVHTETDHLDYPSIFYNLQVTNDKDELEAIKVWELAADEKYIDIKGYGLSMLYASIDPQDCAKIEVDKIDTLLKTGLCELLIKYDDFDLIYAYQLLAEDKFQKFHF